MRPPPHDVCIVMLSAIGDAVHVLPVANALKRAWPECRITWIIQPVPRRMVGDHPAIDDFIVFERRRGLRGWTGFHDLMPHLKERRFDLLLGLQVYFKAGLITALTPARVKLGFDRARARDAQWLVTNERIPPRGHQHVQDQYFEFLRHLGVDPEPVRWGIEFTDEERARQADFLAADDRPVCAVVVGTSKPAKNWHAKGYARVVDEIERRHGLRPVIVGGPSTTERAIAEDVVALSRAEVAVELGDDIRRLMWIIDGSRLVISPDTGPMHISRALETPVVSLFGHTNPKRAGPYRAYSELVVDGYARHPDEDYPISPRYRDGMGRVQAEDVLERVDLALASYLATRPAGDRA